MERLREGIESLPPGPGAISLRTSIGIAELTPDAAVEEIIERADCALLLAKEPGRDRVVV